MSELSRVAERLGMTEGELVNAKVWLKAGLIIRQCQQDKRALESKVDRLKATLPYNSAKEMTNKIHNLEDNIKILSTSNRKLGEIHSKDVKKIKALEKTVEELEKTIKEGNELASKIRQQALEEQVKELEKFQCQCSPDETTGWTAVNCCNICGRPIEGNWRILHGSDDIF